jgi:regulator of sigma E protease
MSVILDYGPWFLGLLTILVFVHELGHYLAARLVGVHASAFSVGFGPELFGWTDKRGCRWRFALIPLGGYVKMQGDADVASAGHEEAAEQPGGLLSASVGRRALIFAAGPAANFILAAVVSAIVFMTAGQQITPPIVGDVAPNSPAESVGLQPGDRILSINGSRIRQFEQVADIEFTAAGTPMAIEVGRGSETLTLTATPDISKFEDRFGNSYERGRLGLYAAVPAKIGRVHPNSAAQSAGLQAGDKIISLNGAPMPTFREFALFVRARPAQVISAEVERDGRRIVLNLTPAATTATVEGTEQTIGRIGVNAAARERVQLNPLTASGAGVVYVWDMSGRILDYIWQIVIGLRPVNEIGGVLRIAQIAGDTARISLLALITFGVLLSINLGLINLFPVPMLDGGHLAFLAVEWARGRRMSERAEEMGYRVGFAMVIGLMLFATWNDLTHFQVFDRLQTWLG